ncbi:MAG TPA: solute:sodium symporter family transporter [Kiritimatiellia bacterium]|nr:solute:sodium symporter family transporter [Kiritimatiellia bacterium]
MHSIVLLSFLFFTGLVAFITWRVTRKDDHASSEGFFLAGRRLTFPFIAGSLLLTNLSTEQLVGLNGAAFSDGFSVMAWEVLAVAGLVAMALFFLPRYLKSGITTIPQLMEIRFDHGTQVITNLIFLGAYATILLPIILYSGAMGLVGMMDVGGLTGIESEAGRVWLIVLMVGIIGATYALWGGLRTVAVSDTLNGIGLLVGGLSIVYFGLRYMGNGEGMFAGLDVLRNSHPERFNSIGGPAQSVPFSTLFTGVLILNVFYWSTNQQIIQRVLGARNLAEGQKGVLLTAFLKLLGPLYLVLPGMMAYHLYVAEGIRPDQAYGHLVRDVLPAPLTGFFAAVMVGAILSSFNSVLNSSCTLFSLGIYKGMINKDASEKQVVRAGRWFGWMLAAYAMIIAPQLLGQTSIFGYLQKMNGIYAIPIFAVVLMALLSSRVTALGAKTALITGVTITALAYFVSPFSEWAKVVNEFHLQGIVFALLIAIMLVMARLKPAPAEWVQQDAKAVDLTPWKHTRRVCVVLGIIVLSIYVKFADFSVLQGP